MEEKLEKHRLRNATNSERKAGGNGTEDRHRGREGREGREGGDGETGAVSPKARWHSVVKVIPSHSLVFVLMNLAQLDYVFFIH